MKTIAQIAGAVLLGVCMAGIACAEENSVTATGKGEIKQKPDVAYVTLYVKGDALTMVDAAKEADQKVDAVKNALKKYKEIMGIEITDAAMGDVQRQYYSPDQKEEGYHPQIARRIRISTPPDPAQIYQMIDTAASAGAIMQIPSSVHYSDDIRTIVVYGLLKRTDAETQAHEAAMIDAKRQAELLAAMAGKKTGAVLRIGADSYFSMSRFSVRFMGRESDFPTPYVGQNPDEVTVGSSLSVVYEMK